MEKEQGTCRQEEAITQLAQAAGLLCVCMPHCISRALVDVQKPHLIPALPAVLQPRAGRAARVGLRPRTLPMRRSSEPPCSELRQLGGLAGRCQTRDGDSNP